MAAAIFLAGQAVAKPAGPVKNPTGKKFKNNSIYADLTGDPYLYFPTATENDARFLAIVGDGLASLGDQKLTTKLAVPRTSQELEIGLFDGDTGGLWDVGASRVRFTLYADPLNNGAESIVLRTWYSDQMADNAWTTLLVPRADFENVAKGSTGHFFFNLRIEQENPSNTSLNAFKLRARGTVALRPTAFSVYGSLRTLQEGAIIYPLYPASLVPTTYDGTWNFFMDVPSAVDSMEIWDGDLDHGSFNGSAVDSSDPDTDNSSDVVVKVSTAGVSKRLPSWANPDFVQQEGAKGVGIPADDAPNAIFCRTPSLVYDLITPNGMAFTNTNPSGTEEWERFRVSTSPFDRSQMDYNTDSLPAGTYQVRVRGMDLANLNAFKFEYDALGVSRDGLPGKPLRAFDLGDTVWLDLNGDHVQQSNEPGIAGVKLSLVDAIGTVIETATTDANGHYLFELDNGQYLVQITETNLEYGGALDGLTSTTGGEVLAGSINGASDHSVDFGYRPSNGLSSCVFLDANRNGSEEDDETGFTGVTVRAFRIDPLLGPVLEATTVTTTGGRFFFHDLQASPTQYEIRVDSLTLPLGLTPTTDADGIGTPHSARTSVPGNSMIDLRCFGYAGNGSIGDKVWCDDNHNDEQDADDPGIGAVRITLRSSQYTANAVTDADGYYHFDNLPMGIYTVEVYNPSLPLNRVFCMDRDGQITPGSTIVVLTILQMDVDDADFGYCGTGLIGDTVWLDSNRNGIQDSGEPGIPGVTVNLSGDLDGNGTEDYHKTVTTDSSGKYLFRNLFLANYTVTVDALAHGLEATHDLDGIATLNKAALSLGAYTLENLNVDFGYVVRPSSVGDVVWMDADHDGVQGDGEEGLPGVTVKLLAANGNVLATTTTDADGLYLFDQLAAGDYSVVVSGAPNGLAPSFDLDGVATAGKASFTLAAGEAKRDVDFGYGPNGSIGDTVWLDADLNGAQNGGEAGLSGATVTLKNGDGIVVATTTTDATGQYLFNYLPAGSYTVLVSNLPSGSVATYDLDGVTTAGKASINLAAGEAKRDVDFGYGRVGSIGDRVWMDTNRNGAQDSGEPGLSGVTVELRDANGATLDTATTDASGQYLFDGLTAGNYVVVLTDVPAALIETFDLDGIGTEDNAAVTLGAGVNKLDVDFGYANPLSSVGDRVWLDTNRNGVQDSGETGISGVTVKLLDSTGATISTKTTDADGSYLFDQIEAGSYSVTVTGLPAGSIQSFDLDGVSTAGKASFTLAAGAAKRDVDFGYAPPFSSVGDRVWNDANRNGVQDSGEAGISGVTVKLLDSAGATISTKTTDASGLYLFEQLEAGTYTVQVTTPGTLTQTFDLDGLSTAGKASFTLAAGDAKRDVDFGYGAPPAATLASVGDRVWRDSNLNGAQDSGETGISGVTVTLKNGSTTVGTATTNANGEYLFSNLAAGSSYSVTVSNLPSGLTQSFDLDGVSTAGKASFTLAAGAAKRDVDFGYGTLGSIGDRVWLDSDLDGVQDSTESGLACVTVKLLNSSGTVLATTTTSSTGYYQFTGLAAGTYSVAVSGVASGLSPTFDLDGVSTAQKASVTITAGQTRVDADFGYGPISSVGDRVWKDTDGDGCQDSGETGIAGVTVTLRNSSGTVLATATTDANGYYLFENLVPATYSVTVSNIPSGYTQTFDLDGVSSANKVTGPLGSGENRRDADFGYKPAAPPVGSIGDKVWLDCDLDGVQDSNESGLGCVTVKLYTSSGTYITSTTTNSSGNYLFSNLQAGSYIVVVSGVSCGLAPTFDLDGVGTADKATVTITAGQNRRDVDFGYGPVCSVGDRVWADTDGDRCQDSNELGIAGVTVKLLNSSGSVIATATTDSSGKYEFDNLAPGNYSVTVSGLPSGYTQTYDLDGTSTAAKASFSLGSGDDRRDVDFGYRPAQAVKSSIGNRVWLDTDRDGVQDSNEGGIGCVTVKLYTSTGTLVATTTTSSSGAYLFSNLAAGSYSVVVSGLASGLTPTFDLDGVSTSSKSAVTLAAGQDRTDVDFGFGPSCAINSCVWKDSNNNRCRDSNEVGYSGCTVKLYTNDGNCVATTTTDSKGCYKFENIVPGSYCVKVTNPPSSCSRTYDCDGTNTPDRSNVNLSCGDNRQDCHFGYRN